MAGTAAAAGGMEHKNRADESDPFAASDASDPHAFGHGFALCGAVVLHLLDQREKFQALDFSYRVLSVHSASQASDDLKRAGGAKVPNVDPVLSSATARFVEEARAQMAVHDLAFSMIDASGAGAESAGDEIKAMYTYSPPADDRDVKALDSRMRSLLHKKSQGRLSEVGEEEEEEEEEVEYY